jgi:hypothetical protein
MQCILCVWGAKHRRAIFHAQVVLMRFPYKAYQDTLRQTCVFASGGICGSCSVFWCFHGVKCRRYIFHARVGPYGLHKKHVRTRYVEHVFLHPVGAA